MPVLQLLILLNYVFQIFELFNKSIKNLFKNQNCLIVQRLYECIFKKNFNFGYTGSLLLLVVSGDCYLVVVHRLLIAVASLGAEHRLQNVGSTVLVLGLSCSVAGGIFLDWRWNPCPLHWQSDS